MSWDWIALIVLTVAPLGIGGLAWHYGRLEGEHRGRCAERDRQVERARREAERKLGPAPEIRAKTGPLPVLPPIRRAAPPAAVTAADIQPVKLTDTGELRAISERGAAIRRAMVTGEHAWRTKTGLS